MNYPNYNVTVNDATVFTEPVPVVRPIKCNILIAGVYEKGETNTLQQFYAGETERFIRSVCAPNYAKYGVGPDIAVAALENDVDLGVLVANIRPEGSTCANVALAVRVKTIKNVPETNELGEPLYLTPSNQKVTEATGNTPIVRDVLEAEYVKYTFTGVTNDKTLRAKLDALYDDADAEGYEIIPLVAFRYIGASAYGNNLHFRMLDKVSAVDGKMYYYPEIFNGENLNRLRDAVSMFPESVMFNQSLFIETLMKLQQSDIKVVSSLHYDKFIDKLYEVVTDKDPMTLNLFNADEYRYRTTGDSLDVTKDRAFVLQNGSNGDMTKLNQAYQNLFAGETVTDITSAIRWRIDFIPDLEYGDEVCTFIETFLEARKHTTNFRRMMGNTTFESATAEYLNNNKDNYNVSLIAACQSGTQFNSFSKRTCQMPASYYDTLCFVRNVVVNKGIPYLPMAGKSIRWTGFDEDSMMYPKESDTVMSALSTARINFIKKDKEAGGYLFTQHTRTKNVSDLTEFSNVMMISSILYDMIDMIHARQYTFNDYGDIAKFNEDIMLDIQPTYTPLSTFIKAKVYKKGLYGEDKNTNVIKVFVNFKDLFKNAEVEIEVTDKTLDEIRA